MSELKLTECPLSGTNLVEASAGTGKTYTLSRIYLRLLLEKRLQVKEILVVTFTNAATEELRGRIRELIRTALESTETGVYEDTTVEQIVKNHGPADDARTVLAAALRSFDEAAIFTIHSFCMRALSENAFESGIRFDTELLPDDRALTQEVVNDYWRRHFYDAELYFNLYLMQEKYSRQSFSKLLDKNIVNPGLTIIPEEKYMAAVTDADIEAFRDAFNAVSECWKRKHAEVEDIFFNSDDLKGSIYTKNIVNRYISDFPAVLDIGASPSLILDFEKFTSPAIAKGTKNKHTPPEHDFFRLFETLYNAAEKITSDFDHEYIDQIKGSIPCFKIELRRKKALLNIHSYDDLLTVLHDALQGPLKGQLIRAVQEKYKAALIDEFQDTDPLQYGIFKAVFGGKGGTLYLIGDPKQAIYSFRGADIFTYINAARSTDKKFTLLTNRRSEPKLIDAVNTVFTKVKAPFVFNDDIQFNRTDHSPDPHKAPLTISGKGPVPMKICYFGIDGVGERYLSKDKKSIKKGSAYALIAGVMANEIVKLLNKGVRGEAKLGEEKVKPEHIAVLVQSRFEARYVKEAFSERNIPAVLSGAGNIFDSDEAEEVERVMRAAANPGNEMAIKAALSTSILGFTARNLDEIVADNEAFEKCIEKFRTYHEQWSRHGFIPMFSRIMQEHEVRQRVLGYRNGDRKFTNILHLMELMQQKDREEKPGIEGLEQWLSIQRDPATQRQEEHELRLESDSNAVKIVTMHKSKGLEYPIVYCPYVWRGSDSKKDEIVRYHDEHRSFAYTLDLGSELKGSHRHIMEKENLAENIRLLYVAFTRAKNLCCVFWGRFNKADTSAPVYLFHRPDMLSQEMPVSDLKEHYKALDDKTMLADLQRLESESSGAVKLLDPELGPDKEPETILYEPEKESAKNLSCRGFRGNVSSDWRVSSFSSLVYTKHEVAELPDRDGIIRVDEPELTGVESEDTIFSFPKGARSGTFLHDLLEHMDFTEREPAALDELVSRKIRAYGYEQKWQKVVSANLRKWMQQPLSDEVTGLTLSAISQKRRLNELEFYFPLKKTGAKKLAALFSKSGRQFISENLPEQIGTLDFRPAQGFMRGFIDLVFEHNDMYYIIDWKSNHLGYACEDYLPSRLFKPMLEHFYYIQYHIYTMAVDRYLSTRIKDYDYERHFGGVFYIFLRGIDADPSCKYGIYSDRPSGSFVKTMCRELIGESTRK